MFLDSDYCPEKTLVSHEQQIKTNLLDQAAGIEVHTPQHSSDHYGPTASSPLPTRRAGYLD
jgi:hypothetical protein